MKDVSNQDDEEENFDLGDIDLDDLGGDDKEINPKPLEGLTIVLSGEF